MSNIEIIASAPKIKKVEDILVNIDLISDLLKEDVVRIIKKVDYFCDESFEEKYAEAILHTKKQLNKHHLRLYKRIFTCKNIKQALNLLLIRMANNVKNQFDKNRKGTVAYWSAKTKETVKQNVSEKMQAADPLALLLDKEMQILSEEEKIENLKNYKEEIAKIAKIEKNENNNFQLIFNF